MEKTFKIPDDLRELLRIYGTFRLKERINTIENKFYVGAFANFSGFEIYTQSGNGWHTQLKGFYDKVEYICFTVPSARNDKTFSPTFITTFNSKEDFLKEFEPVTDDIANKKFKYRLKIGSFEFIKW